GIVFLIKQIHPLNFNVYDPKYADEYIDNPALIKEKYNDASYKIPAIFRYAFGNERVNVTYIRLDGEVVNLAIEIQKGNIKSAEKGEMKNPTLNVNIQESSMIKISKARDTIDGVKKAFSNKEITYECLTIKTSIKMALFRFIIWIWSLFGIY
ncbi:MAG: hypothetical protein N3D84_04125, partial [Candidatus Woesearchaeota archaeon]|nr:hypothetical protein [Candidatus Woesearchaeota archaeon]